MGLMGSRHRPLRGRRSKRSAYRVTTICLHQNAKERTQNSPVSMVSLPTVQILTGRRQVRQLDPSNMLLSHFIFSRILLSGFFQYSATRTRAHGHMDLESRLPRRGLRPGGVAFGGQCQWRMRAHQRPALNAERDGGLAVTSRKTSPQKAGKRDELQTALRAPFHVSGVRCNCPRLWPWRHARPRPHSNQMH